NDLQRVVALHDHAFDAASLGILLLSWKPSEGLVGSAQLGQALAEIRKAQHLREAADDGAVDRGVGDARQGKGEIRGGDGPCLLTGLARCKAWVGMEKDAWADVEAIGLLAVRQLSGFG